jgi:hypothetical protein
VECTFKGIDFESFLGRAFLGINFYWLEEFAPLNLTEVRSKIIEDKKLSIHKKYINKVMQTKIAHLVVKRSRKFIEFCLIKADIFLLFRNVITPRVFYIE